MLSKTCLNGFWEFSIGKSLDIIPECYEKKKIHVPSPYNINSFAKGYHKQTAGEGYYVNGGDFRLYPDYPVKWEQAECGFYKRSIFVSEESSQNRIFLCFEAVAYKSVFYLNGVKVYEDAEAFLPIEFEVTDYVYFGGENELIVGAQIAKNNAYHDENGRKRTDYPEGSFWGGHIGGIWQDVFMIERPKAYLFDLFAKTDVYENRLEIEYNYSDKIVEKLNDRNQSDKNHSCGDLRVEFLLSGRIWGIEDKEQVIYSGSCDGSSAVWNYQNGEIDLWDVGSPCLYQLKGRIYSDGILLDETVIRFGFRTFHTKGNRFLLNGKPIMLKCDSWHYMGYSIQTPEYARSYYKMARDANVNIIRLHAQPFPSFFYDIADEMGMLLISESAVWASHCNFSYNDDFFENSRKHVKRLIIRDRNHPSVVMWSPENECIPAYKVCGSKYIKDVSDLEDKLYELTTVIPPLDPTRIISCDGSGDLGGRMQVNSLHYPGYHCPTHKEKPITIGEMGSMYFSTPDNVSMDYGRRALESMSGRLESVALDAFHNLTGQRRWAAQICVFNLIWYGLKPLPFQERELQYNDSDYEQPGIKPRRITPYLRTLNASAEEGLVEYEPNEVFTFTKEAFMPVCFFVEDMPEDAYLNESVRINVTIFYDEREDGRLHFDIVGKSDLQDEIAYTAVYEMEACTYVQEEIALEVHKEGIQEFVFTLRKEIEGESCAGTELQCITKQLRVYSKEKLKNEWEALNIILIKDGDEEPQLNVAAIDIRRSGEYSSFMKEHDIKKVFSMNGEYILARKRMEYYFKELLNFNGRPIYFNGAGMPVAVSICESGIPRIICGLDLSKADEEPLYYKLMIEMGAYLKEASYAGPKAAYVYSKLGSRLCAMLDEVCCSYDIVSEEELVMLLEEKQERTLLADGGLELDWLKYIGCHNFETVVVFNADKTPELFSHLYEITEKRAYHLIPKGDMMITDSVMIADDTQVSEAVQAAEVIKPFGDMQSRLGLYGNGLYGLSSGKEEVMAEKLMLYRQDAGQNIMLGLPDIDWRMWNHNAEYLKTVSLLKSEQTDNSRYSAFSVHEYCESQIYLSQMWQNVSSRKSKNCMVRLLTMAGVKVDIVRNDELNELLFTGVYSNKLNTMLHKPLSEGEDVSALMPGMNKIENRCAWTVRKENASIGNCALAVFIYSPQDRTDLLLNPDTVDMIVKAEKEVSVYLNGAFKQSGSSFTVTSIELTAGYNQLVIYCKDSQKMPELSFVRTNLKPLDLKFGLYDGEIKKCNLKNAECFSYDSPERAADAVKELSDGHNRHWVSKTDQHYGIDFQIKLSEETDIKALYFSSQTSDIGGSGLTPYRFKIYVGSSGEDLEEVYESLREDKMHYPEGKVLIRLDGVRAKHVKIMLTENALKPFAVKDMSLLV